MAVATPIQDRLLRDVPTVDGYKVLEPVVLVDKLPEGGMAAVYRGLHLDLKLDVAVKVLKPAQGQGYSPAAIARFRQEAEQAARLNHQNLVRIYDFPASKIGLLYIVMEFVDGETIESRVARKGPLTPHEAVTIIYETVSGLRAAHAENVIHRDIKPPNILISKRGHVKIADLGIAKAQDSAAMGVTQDISLLGTPQYMSPELWRGAKNASQASDVWALGATLGFMLTGKHLIDGADANEIMHKTVTQGFTGLSRAAPAKLAKIIAACMDASPRNRPTTADLEVQFAEHLERLGGEYDLADPLAGGVPTTPVSTRIPSRTDLDEIRRQLEKIKIPTPLPGTLPQRERPGTLVEKAKSREMQGFQPPIPIPRSPLGKRRPKRSLGWTVALILFLGLVGVLGYTGMQNGWFGEAKPLAVNQPAGGSSAANIVGGTPVAVNKPPANPVNQTSGSNLPTPPTGEGNRQADPTPPTPAPPTPAPPIPTPPTPAKPPIELVFVFGSEKKDWLNKVTPPFNKGAHLSLDGRPIQVKLQSMGSGELAKLLKENGAIQPHLASPASSLHLEQVGGNPLGTTRSLVKSPVVIATWEDRAKAMGWPHAAIGWKRVLDQALDDRQFKFGQTHPDHSNSGLIAVIAQVYASTGKFEGLTVADANSPAASAMLAGIGRSVDKYGSSTGNLGTMMSLDPTKLDAAVLYENMVIEHNSKKDIERRMVAIYPSEGTFMSDHPVGIVQRPWVTPAHAEAAEIYIKYLLDKPQQQEALRSGFRPGAAEVPIEAPIDTAHGVDPKPPRELKVPPTDVIEQCLSTWTKAKKPFNVVLAVGPMAGPKAAEVLKEAAALIDCMRDKDRLTLVGFSGTRNCPLAGAMMTAANRQQAKKLLQGIVAGRDLMLYDAVSYGHWYLGSAEVDIKKETVSTLIVLSNGRDSGEIPLADFTDRIKFDAINHPVMTVVIPFGDADCVNYMKEVAGVSSGLTIPPEKMENPYRMLSDLSATFFSAGGPGGATPTH